MGVFNNKRNVIILVFFVAAILFIIYSMLFSNDTSKKQELKSYSEDEIKIYTVKENIIDDYNIFYTFEGISSQIITALKDKKYNEIYSILTKELIGDISKEKWKGLLEEFYTDNFSDVTNGDGKTSLYQISRNLSVVYKIDSNNYILEVRNNHNSTTRMGIKLLNNSEYDIFYLEF